MTTFQTDVVVVGVGIAGAATAHALAASGRDVVAVERYRIGHSGGSSHGASRIFRFSYHDAAYVAMAQRSLARWRSLEEECGEELIRTTGGLDFGKPLDAHVAALDACGATYELLSGADLMERWPYVAVAPDARALFQPDAGICHAERAWRAFVAGARSRGADIREECRAVSLHPDGEGVVLVTEDGEMRSRVAVVTAGPWARGLLGPIGIDLPVRPSLETVAYFAMERAMEVPSVVDWGDPAVYSLASPEPLGLKVGLHHAGPEVDPDRGGEPADGTLERVAAWVRERFPAASPVPLRADTCFYTNTPDETFILERRGRVVVGSACSGHGFKFAPLTGERLAALALDEVA